MPSIFTLEGPKLRPVPCDPRSVDQEQLRIGTLVEMEHTRDPVAAQTIALHHLCETFPHPYYVQGAGVQSERLLLNGSWSTLPKWMKWVMFAGGAVGLYWVANKGLRALQSTSWGEERYAQSRERSFHGSEAAEVTKMLKKMPPKDRRRFFKRLYQEASDELTGIG
jgi:hypothetical protein